MRALPAAPPTVPARWALVLLGLAAAATSFTLALLSEDVSGTLGEPLLIAALTAWITLSYVVCGLVAWWRRPANRFGPLLIVAGFVNFLSTLVWSSRDVLHTLGQVLDLVPPVLFLHVFLAFPDGRLKGRFVRSFVATAYVVAIALELVRMSAGDFGPHNLLHLYSNAGVEDVAWKVQLLTVSACCLAGVVVLGVRGRRAGRPLRRSVALVVDAFGLALVLIAFLFVSAVFDWPAVAQIRWAAFIALALAPTVFLIGLLQARLARSALGELFLELRLDLTPSDLRDALARTLRDPSLELAYWLPEYKTYADVDGRALTLRQLAQGRATTLIDREREARRRAGPRPFAAGRARVARCSDRSCRNRRRERSVAGRVESAARRAPRVTREGDRRWTEGAPATRAQSSRWCAAAPDRVVTRAEPARTACCGRSRCTQEGFQAREEIAISLEELRDVARGIHPAVLSGHGLEVALESMAARAPVPVRLIVDLDGRLHERLEVAATTSFRRVSRTSPSMRAQPRPAWRSREATGRSSSRSWTTGSAEPTPKPARACAGSRTASSRSAAGSESGRRGAAVRV